MKKHFENTACRVPSTITGERERAHKKRILVDIREGSNFRFKNSNIIIAYFIKILAFFQDFNLILTNSTHQKASGVFVFDPERHEDMFRQPGSLLFSVPYLNSPTAGVCHSDQGTPYMTYKRPALYHISYVRATFRRLYDILWMKLTMHLVIYYWGQFMS